MRRPRLFLLLAMLSVTLLGATASARAAERVDVALVLAVDVSLSMSAEELRIQRQGYAAAISSPEVIRAIRRGAYGRIAVTMFEWAADTHDREIFGWTVIETASDAEAVAQRMLATPSFGRHRTSISGAIRRGMALLEASPHAADRRVIDISGDGPNNQGVPVTQARDEAIAAGYVVNGLPLMTTGGFGGAFNIPDLDRYYTRCVIGGPGGFMVPVNDWDQFPEAIRRKLVLEIGQAAPRWPEPVLAQFQLEEPYDCMIGEKIWRQRGWQFDDFDR